MGRGAEAIYELQTGGKRMTKAREALIELFADHGKPLNVKEVQRRLSLKGVAIHKVTLYREIEFLIKHRVVQEVYLGTDEALYESTGREHHHHMVCFDCKKVEEVPVEKEFEKMEAYLYKKSGFSMFKHAAEFFGLCKKCESKY